MNILYLLKSNWKETTQILCFGVGKIFLGVAEMPRYQKSQQSFIPVLIFAFIFYIISMVVKIIKNKVTPKALVIVSIRMFLIWIVSALSIIFSFSLCQEMGWNSLQSGGVVGCLVIQTIIVVIFCSWRHTSKLQFVSMQVILSINIVVLGIKTVIFIQKQQNSPHKDIVLLNLTTQIALAILEMDAIERAYAKYHQKIKKIPSVIQQQLTNQN